PHQQAAPRLEHAHVARRLRVAPAVPADRLVPEAGAAVHRQPVVGAREAAQGPRLDQFVVGIQDPGARPLRGGLAVTGDAAFFEDRLHVAEVLDALDALRIRQSRLAAGVPLFARFVALLARQQRRLVGQVPDLVVRAGGGGLVERRGLLAVGVAAAAVV